jgi:hypothetical protein
MEHRSEEKEIVAIHESDHDIRVADNGPLHLECGVQTAETAAKNDDTFFLKPATSLDDDEGFIIGEIVLPEIVELA